MTLPASASPLSTRLPSADDRHEANLLGRYLATQKSGETVLQVPDPETMKQVEITLTPAMTDLFLELVGHIGSGDAVTVVPIHQMLTTQQAADLLNVSCPHLINLFQAGDIKAELHAQKTAIRPLAPPSRQNSRFFEASS
jgi:hypothetical protein